MRAGGLGTVPEMSDDGPMGDEPDGAGVVTVTVDHDCCIGSGNCVFLAPATFDLTDDGHAAVLDPAATAVDRLVVTAEGCPVGAISVWRDGARLDHQGD